MEYKSAYKILCPDCNKWHYPNKKCIRTNNLMKNNPKGYNKHKKNPKPKPKKKTIKETVNIEMVQDAYRDFKRKEAAYKGAKSLYGRIHRAFLGIDKIDKEFEGKK